MRGTGSATWQPFFISCLACEMDFHVPETRRSFELPELPNVFLWSTEIKSSNLCFYYSVWNVNFGPVYNHVKKSLLIFVYFRPLRNKSTSRLQFHSCPDVAAQPETGVVVGYIWDFFSFSQITNMTS